MSLILSGTDGLSDVDGSAATPAIRGTDANTGMFFPAADTIAFAEGGVESMRIDSSGNVGIGTSSPTSKLDVVGTIRLINTATPANISLIADLGGLYLQSLNSNPLYFATGGSERMRIDSSGNLLVGKTSATANGGDIQVSSGITFPATQVAKSDANTLDDYEEGTFTPTITTDGAPVTTYTTQTGKYTKVGNVVYFQIGIVWNSFTGTGNVTIGGFPFPVPVVDPAKTISMPVISSTTAGLANYSLSDFRTSGSFTALYLYSFTGVATSIATVGTSGTITIKSFYFV